MGGKELVGVANYALNGNPTPRPQIIRLQDTAATDWDGWRHAMPFLSLRDIHAMSQAGKMFKMIVRLFFASGKVIVEGDFLKEFPVAKNKGFYTHIGRLATRLAIHDGARYRCCPAFPT